MLNINKPYFLYLHIHINTLGTKITEGPPGHIIVQLNKDEMISLEVELI